MKRIALWIILVTAIAFGGCGSDGSSTPPTSPTPAITPTPAQFTGHFVGSAALDAGQTGTVSITVNGDTTVTGTLTITGGGMPDMVVPLTGFADLIGGNFSLRGDSDVVSGTLPASSGGTGFLAIQIGASTTPFHGTITAS